MKEYIRKDASLEALSKKSFKKYLKTLIKDKENLLSTYEGVLHDTHEANKKVRYEYYLLCQLLDDYVYFQELKKDKKESECKI